MLYKKFSWILIVPVLICLSVPAVPYGAGMPQGKWWRLPYASEQLDLTDPEKNELDELFVQSHRLMIDLKSTLEREQFELDNLIDRPVLDETSIMDQMGKIQEARASLDAERYRVLLKVRKILGFERYQNLKMLFKELREKKRRH